MNEYEELNNIAMKIILNAGDARNLINKAFMAMESGDYESSEKDLSEAQNCLLKAHEAQTTTIQSNVTNTDFIPTLLFIHAQDTLMTVYSELNMIKKMFSLYKTLLAKVDSDEKKHISK